MKTTIASLLLLFSIAVMVSCQPDYALKPKSYPRIHYPISQSVFTYAPEDCPYSFTLPTYYRVEKKEKFFDENISGDCWVNVICDSLNGTIYLSYKPLQDSMSLLKLMEDAYTMTYKHTNKADFIQPSEIDNGAGAIGLIYYVGGEAASNIQFFITDTNQHFVRGALYFYARPNTDSLRPVVEYVVHDIQEMLASWRWKN
jgi:gliding motility-associated lipoprotein GldD